VRAKRRAAAAGARAQGVPVSLHGTSTM
jgi:hypothetical protein